MILRTLFFLLILLPVSQAQAAAVITLNATTPENATGGYLPGTVVGFDADQAALARSAYERWGKGRHPAALNLGDCCSYALTQTSGEPLLFKGSDFSRTDIVSVV